MAFFKHENALVETQWVGDGSRIWAFAHILPGARIGRECNICDHTFIENDVVLGDRVTVKCGVQLWDGVTIEDDVFIGPNATFTNDPFPRSRKRPERFERTVVQSGASIGANATILPGVVIGRGAMIGAGAVVTRSTPPNSVVTGNPARITGYVGVREQPVFQAQAAPAGSRLAAGVEGVVLHRLPLVDDLRGALSFGEVQRHIPFEIKRYFLVFGVSGQHIRGEHAHREQHQFLVCVHGRCNIVADDGTNREEFILDGPTTAVYIPPMVWAVQYKYTPDAVLLVLASGFYDPEDYIRDYDEFQSLRASAKRAAGQPQ